MNLTVISICLQEAKTCSGKRGAKLLNAIKSEAQLIWLAKALTYESQNEYSFSFQIVPKKEFKKKEKLKWISFSKEYDFK